MRYIYSLVWLLCAVAVNSGPAAAERRVALVLGMSSYTNAPALKNPETDARDMAGALKRLGFEVIEGYNLDHRSFSRHIRKFSKALSGAQSAVFFYAGHGMQVAGRNYLVPVDAVLTEEADLDFEAVSLDLVIKQMQRDAKVSLVFLDACRDNPLASRLKARTRSTAIGRGLARIEEAAGMLVSFSTQPGNVALDGQGRNSPFTRALLRHIETPGVTVNDVMIEVRKQVIEETSEKQVPWESSSLTGRFFFRPGRATGQDGPIAGAPRQQVLTVDDSAMDHTFWTSIRDLNDPALYNAYLQRFPSGVFALVAQAKLDKLAAAEAGGLPSDANTAAATNSNTQLALAASNAAAAQAAPPPSVRALSVPEVVLSPYEAARQLQTELKRVGCYSSGIDGAWGPGSRRAVSAFNKHSGLSLPERVPQARSVQAVRRYDGRICPVVKVVRRRSKSRRSSTSSRSRSRDRRDNGSSDAAAKAAGAALVGGIVGGFIGGRIGRRR